MNFTRQPALPVKPAMKTCFHVKSFTPPFLIFFLGYSRWRRHFQFDRLIDCCRIESPTLTAGHDRKKTKATVRVMQKPRIWRKAVIVQSVSVPRRAIYDGSRRGLHAFDVKIKTALIKFLPSLYRLLFLDISSLF